MGIQLITLFLLGLIIPSLINCNMEGDILNVQKQAWDDPNNVLQSWDPTLVNPCTWFHVTCNNDNSVVRLDLGNAGISGPLVPELGRLGNLQYVEIHGNKLRGRIPTTLGNLSNLLSLDLYNNSLSGEIPYSLGFLKSLRFLRLNGNNLSGNIPRSVLRLVVTGSLELLDVSHNTLTGTRSSSKPRVTSIIQDQRINTT